MCPLVAINRRAFAEVPQPRKRRARGRRRFATSIIEYGQPGGQVKFADFAHGIARKLANEKDAPRHLVGRQRSAAVVDQFGLFYLRANDDEGGNILAASGRRPGDDGRRQGDGRRT